MGMWSLIERKDGTGASGNITFTGLNGDTDKMYKIIGTGKSSVSAIRTVELNGIQTNHTSTYWGSTPAGSWVSGSTLALEPANADDHSVEIIIWADKTGGVVRSWIWESTSVKNSFDAIQNGAGIWNDTTTLLTSIDMNLSTGNWATNTKFWLYKLTNP